VRGCGKVGRYGVFAASVWTLSRKGWRVQHVGNVRLNIMFLAETLFQIAIFMVVLHFVLQLCDGWVRRER
jgi:hypothetical protein